MFLLVRFFLSTCLLLFFVFNLCCTFYKCPQQFLTNWCTFYSLFIGQWLPLYFHVLIIIIEEQSTKYGFRVIAKYNKMQSTYKLAKSTCVLDNCSITPTSQLSFIYHAVTFKGQQVIVIASWLWLHFQKQWFQEHTIVVMGGV